MPSSASNSKLPSAAVVAAYNAVPNVLWSVVVWVPVVVFCYQAVARPWLYGCIIGSLLAYAWPAAWLRRLQLSTRAEVYRQLRVPLVGHFTQQGTLVKALLRRRYPQYRALTGRKAIPQLLSTTYQQERFHWAALVLLLLLSIYALATSHLGWALGLILANVGYNLYPIWLQQYVRLRLGHGSNPGR